MHRPVREDCCQLLIYPVPSHTCLLRQGDWSVYQPFANLGHKTHHRYLPEQRECKKPSKKPAMNSINTEEHFGACGTGQGLTDGKDLLVLETC